MKKTPDYKTVDIIRYLKNEMSNPEMRQLELAALNDPFLQDAIDGYREIYETEGLETIQKHLGEVIAYPPQKEEKRRIVPLWRQKIFQYAAAAAIVAGTGWFIFNLSQPESTLTGTTPENAELGTTMTDTNTATVFTAPESKTEQPQPSTEPPLVAKKKQAPVKTAQEITGDKPVARSLESPEVVKEEATAAAMAKADSTESSLSMNPSREVTPGVAVTSPSASNAMAKTATQDNNGLARSFAPVNNYRYTRTVKGKVVDKEKYPLDNIRLQLQGSSKLILSDELGRFEMEVPDTGVTLIASAPGYKTREIKPKKGIAVLEIEMESTGKSLEEVVISGYSSRKKLSASGRYEMDTTEAAPAGGWKKFEAYVLKNKKVAAGIEKPVLVVLSFEVTDKGRPADFDIIESGGESYDKEAIRLLKEGPDWINKTTSSGPMAKITIRF